MDVEFNVTVTLLFLIMAFSFLGNIILMISVLTTRELRGHTSILILNLSISDLCITCFSLPLRLFQMFGATWSNNFASCSITVSLTICFFTASNFNLFLVTLDRFLSVLYPAKYKLNLTKRKLRVAIAVSWLLAFLIAFFPLFFSGAKKNAKSVVTAFVCRYETMLFPKYLIFVIVFTLLVPWVSMIAMYAAILKVVLKTSKVAVIPAENTQSSVEAGRKKMDKNENTVDLRSDLASENVESNATEGRNSNETGRAANSNLEKIADITTWQRHNQQGGSAKETIECNVAERSLSDDEGRDVSSNLERTDDTTAGWRQNPQGYSAKGNVEECDIIEGSLSNEKGRAASLSLEHIADTKVGLRQNPNYGFSSKNIKECHGNEGSLSNDNDRAGGSRLERIEEEPEIDDKQISHENLPSKGLGIRRLQETKLVKGVFIILIFYTIQMVPFGFIDLLELNGTISVPEVVIRIALILAYLNSAVNPPIYAASNKRYRASFWRILSCCRQVRNEAEGRVVHRGDQGSDGDFVTGQPSRM